MNNFQKIKLYILSLSLLFLIVFICSITLPDTKIEYCNTVIECTASEKASNIAKYLKVVITENIIPALMLLMIAISWKFKNDFKHTLQGGGHKVIRIQNIKSEDYEYLTFLATYIIPFVGLSFDDPRRLIAYFILLVIIGVMLIRTDKYYANPTLAVLGFKLYRATACDRNGIYESILLITKDDIEKNEVVNFELLSKNVFYVRKIKA